MLRHALTRSALVTLGIVVGLALTATASANAPTRIPFEETFVDVNPCSGLEHAITVTGTFFVFERGNGISHRLERTITTTSGFVGHGNEISVDHDRIFIVHDTLRNSAGDHIRAQVVLVRDASGTPRVERFMLTCV
jgi:hypothetical protein